MLKNYLKTSIRFLYRNKSYTTLNILGLAVGLSAFLLLTTFVSQEYSYDSFHAKKNRVYQVFLADSVASSPNFVASTQAPAGPLVQDAIPEIVDFTRLLKVTNKVIKVGRNSYLQDEIHFADQSLFSMFNFPLLTGISEALSLSIGDVLISENEALRLFGNASEALGQELEIVGYGTYTVAEIFQNLPENTHLDFEYILSFEGAQKPFEKWEGNPSIFNWGFISRFPLYVELSDESLQVSEVERKMQTALQAHQNKLVKLLPIEESYFSDLNTMGKKGNKQFAQLYLAIAFIILVVAIVNYMNLSTANLAKRAKEVGVRKTVGSNRSQIILQFLTESIIISISSFVLAIILSEFSMQFFSNLLGKPLEINYSDVGVIGFLIGIAIFVGVFSGTYPAYYLSKFHPTQILTSRHQSRNTKLTFRQVLVGFQLFTCLGLLMSTSIIYQQFKHMEQVDKGFNDEQIISVPIKDRGIQQNYSPFKAQLKESPLISDVTGSSVAAFTESFQFNAKPEGMEENTPINLMMVEKNFASVMGIRIINGTDFNQTTPELNGDIMLVNETAQRQFDWENAIGKGILKYKVAGVTGDFIFGSAKEAIEPLMILNQEGSFEHVFVKLNTNEISSSLDKINEVFDKYATDYPFSYSFLDEDFANKYEKEEKLSQAFSIFSLLAVFVAVLGILGLSVYMAQSRMKEVSIRRILGAKTASIVWLLNKSMLLIITSVALIAIPLVHFSITPWLAQFANRINLGPFQYIGPLIVLTLTIWIIMLKQSIQASRSKPTDILKIE